MDSDNPKERERIYSVQNESLALCGNLIPISARRRAVALKGGQQKPYPVLHSLSGTKLIGLLAAAGLKSANQTGKACSFINHAADEHVLDVYLAKPREGDANVRQCWCR